MSLARLTRWIVPGTVLVIAAAGVGLLAVAEVVEDGPVAPPAPRAISAGEAPTLAVAVAPPAAPSHWEAPPAPRAQAPAPRSPQPSGPPLATAPVQAAVRRPATERPWVQETPDTLAATGVLRRLAAVKDLYERLRTLDDLLAKLPPERHGVILKGLLDSQLPGDFYEAENLRLAVLARLGDAPSWDTGDALVARLNPNRPRPERLLAIELLATRPDVGQAQLEAIAREDHDSVVLARARWALSRR